MLATREDSDTPENTPDNKRGEPDDASTESELDRVVPGRDDEESDAAWNMDVLRQRIQTQQTAPLDDAEPSTQSGISAGVDISAVIEPDQDILVLDENKQAYLIRGSFGSFDFFTMKSSHELSSDYLVVLETEREAELLLQVLKFKNYLPPSASVEQHSFKEILNFAKEYGIEFGVVEMQNEVSEIVESELRQHSQELSNTIQQLQGLLQSEPDRDDLPDDAEWQSS